MGSAQHDMAALRAENGELRLQLERLRSEDLTRVVLRPDQKAPGAARTLLGLCFGAVLDPRVLTDAQLLVSEVVTNSIVHGALGDDDNIIVRVQLDARALRVEVCNPGVTGTLASNGGDPERGHGFGLDLVGRLSTSWGVRRGTDTTVWMELSPATG